MLLAVAVFPPGAKKREERDEEPKGNRVGNWTERWTSNRGDLALRVKLLALFPL